MPVRTLRDVSERHRTQRSEKPNSLKSQQRQGLGMNRPTTQNPPVLSTLGVQLPLPAPARIPQIKRLAGASSPHEKHSTADAADVAPSSRTSVNYIPLKLLSLFKNVKVSMACTSVTHFHVVMTSPASTTAPEDREKRVTPTSKTSAQPQDGRRSGPVFRHHREPLLA